MSEKIFNYNSIYNERIQKEKKKKNNFVMATKALIIKENKNLTENEKKNINSIEKTYQNITNTIKTLEKKKLNNFNNNLDNYELGENKLYNLLRTGNKILIRDIVLYEDNPELPIRKEAILLTYIVKELNIIDYEQIEKLNSIIELMLITPNNESLLKKRCDKILSLIRRRSISKNLKREIINMSYHPNRVLNYHNNEISNNTKEFFKL